MQAALDSLTIVLVASLSICIFVATISRLQRGGRGLKIAAGIVFGICAGLSSLYAFKQGAKHRFIVEFKEAFYENSRLSCRSGEELVLVDRRNFIYIEDSHSFKDLARGLSLSILDCESYEKAKGTEILTD